MRIEGEGAYAYKGCKEERKRLWDHRDERRYSLLVVLVLLAKVLDEGLLLIGNPVFEEVPRDIRKGRGTQRIQQHNLSSDAPVEPTQVAGMS